VVQPLFVSCIYVLYFLSRVSRVVHKNRSLMRLLPGMVAVTVTAGSVLLVNGVANADRPAGTLGSDTITPAEGSDIVPMAAKTSAGCTPDSATADLTIVGPVGADGTAPDTATFPSSKPFPVTTLGGAETGQFSTAGPFTQQFRLLLRDAATQRGTTIQTGEYDLTTHCMDEFGFTVLGTFTSGLVFDSPTHYTVIGNVPSPSPTGEPTPSPSPTLQPSPSPSPTGEPSPSPSPTGEPTPSPSPTLQPSPSPSPTGEPTPSPSPAPGARTTAITLYVIHIRLPFGLGSFAIPFAKVAPVNAAGTVQFKDGSTNLGGPVPVGAGFIFGGFVVLPAGAHSLTAEFTPADPTAFQSSTSSTVTF
jgi:hypothetical protein